MFFGVSGNGERSRRLSVVRDSNEPSRAQARAEGTGNGLRDGLRGVGEASARIFGRVEQVERVGLVGETSWSWRVR